MNPIIKYLGAIEPRFLDQVPTISGKSFTSISNPSPVMLVQRNDPEKEASG